MILLALVASGVAGCVASAPPRGPSMALVAPQAVENLTCRLGERVNYRPETFHLDVTILENSATAVQILTSHSDVGLAALPLHRSQAPRFQGQGTITYHLNVHANRLGGQLPFLNGPALCAGMAAVVPEGDGFSRVTIPVSGGPNLGQASLVLPRAALLALRGSFVPCIETSFPTEFNPTLTDGRYAGRPNMQCNKPGKVPGVSHATERVRSGRPGELYVFIHAGRRGY